MLSETDSHSIDTLLNSLLAFFIADTPIGRIIGTPAFIKWLKVIMSENIDEVDSFKWLLDLDEYTRRHNRVTICWCDYIGQLLAFAEEEKLSEELKDKLFSFVKTGVKFIAVSYSSGCSKCYLEPDC
jgi:hypothetical protein